VSRSVIAVSLTLLCGGWVCDGTPPCGADLECSSTPLEHFCCPQGQPYECAGGCSATPQCSNATTCRYEGDTNPDPCTAGTYVASIAPVNCVSLGPSPEWTFDITGQVTGCGTTTVTYFSVARPLAAVLTCGAWVGATTNVPGGPSSGYVGSCQPDQTGTPTPAMWELRVTVPASPITAVTLPVSLRLGVENLPVLAGATLSCPPS